MTNDQGLMTLLNYPRFIKLRMLHAFAAFDEVTVDDANAAVFRLYDCRIVV